ncbi:MAG: hypothetical protein GY853_13685 [PVC group bacterium]|nr:hypothetical protein [PVC group bacterium]
MAEITKEFIEALKKADTLVVRMDKETGGLIEFHKKEKVNKKGWTEPEQIKTFNSFKARLPHNFTSACFVIMYQAETNVKALHHILRAGDILELSAMDNTNSYLKNAEIRPEVWKDGNLWHPHYYGLHNDELTCRIIRKGKVIISRLILDSSNCPDNTARPFNR